MSLEEARSLRHRFLILTATRWLPTGLLIPVMVVLMTERGLTLAEVGVVSAIGAAVVIVLELPTGGLADVLGRRPVLLAASLFNLAATVLMAFAGHLWLFVLVWVFEGVYRALESGPLDAWYVDGALAADADADIEGALAARGLVASVAIGAGALLGGALALAPDGALPVLAWPVLGSAVLRLVDLAALWSLLDEPAATPALSPRGARRGWVPGAVRRASADTVRTIKEACGLLRASAALSALAAVELFWGAGMFAVESLSGPRLADLLGDPREGVFVFALAATLGWAVSGLGSASAPALARATGSWVAAAVVTRLVQGLGLLAAAVIAGPAGLLIGYLGFYLVHGAANVAHYSLMHRHVTAAHRTTMHSVNSLTSRIGLVVVAPPLGALATGSGLPAAFAVSALLLALPAPLYLLARTPPRSLAVPVPANTSS